MMANSVDDRTIRPGSFGRFSLAGPDTAAYEPHDPTRPALSVDALGDHRDLWVAYGRLLDEVDRRGVRPAGRVVEYYLGRVDGRPRTRVALLLSD